jgi:hypothetical protein
MTQCVYRDAGQLAIRVGSGQAVRLPPVGVGLMKARLALSVGCTMAALGGLFPACASSESTSVQDAGGAEADSTTPEDGGGDAGSAADSTTRADADAARSDAMGDADAGAATVGDAGMGEGAAGDGSQDATVTDTGATDTGGQDSAVDVGAMDAGADVEMSEAGGGDAEADAGSDAAVDSGADAAPDAAADAGADTGADSGSDAGQDTGAGLGPVCQRPDGGNYFCSAGQHCCGNAVTRDSVCATTCDQGANYYPVDCPGASGDGGCGLQICCGTLVTGNGIPPACPPQSLTSSCGSSCPNESPPALCGMTSVIRLCTAAADCAADTANPHCCNYGSPPSPVNWCVSDAIFNLGLENSCL